MPGTSAQRATMYGGYGPFHINPTSHLSHYQDAQSKVRYRALACGLRDHHVACAALSYCTGVTVWAMIRTPRSFPSGVRTIVGGASMYPSTTHSIRSVTTVARNAPT